MGSASEKQVAANRRNARHSSGPKTVQGRATSRLNSLKHGLAAEILVPEEDQAAYRTTLKRWEHEAGPSDVVEHHLIRRAAVASVTLDRLDEAREETREEAARDAVKRWERKQQHAARRKAQDLDKDPFGVVADLEATAFGCDWLIRQWQALDGPLAMGNEWTKGQLDKAQRLLGYPAGQPGTDAEPPVRVLWLLAGVLAPFSIGNLPRTPAEAGLPTEADHARAMLRRFVAEEVERLEGLRNEAWEAVEGPERRSVIVRAAAADTSKEGQLRHRYAKDADRSHNAAMRLFLCARGKRRQEYLAIAKEARQSGKLPRVPVGGGWWHEVDCEPAPPGFARVDGSATPSEPGPAPAEAGIVTPTPEPAIDPIPAGAPRRNEPNPAADDSGTAGRKPNPDQPFRDEPAAGPINAPRRTEPLPAASDAPGPGVTGALPGGPDRPDASRTGPEATPRRNEPISTASVQGDPDRKPNSFHGLRGDGPAGPINDAWRTGPRPGPDRPGIVTAPGSVGEPARPATDATHPDPRGPAARLAERRGGSL